MEHILIIGGGGTAAALAHDLALRGFEVTMFERQSLGSGTTGRHHGLLHSGARYAVHDPQTARECIEENRILRRIAPEALEQNDGLFVALTDSDMQYRARFLKGCRDCGIPAKELPRVTALGMEPNLSPDIKTAIQVPDATIDAWRLPMHFLATAKANGAKIHDFREIVGVQLSGNAVTGVRVLDHRSNREADVSADMVVNATGAWAGKVTGLLGVDLTISPSPGVMVTVGARVTHKVVNRLHPAGEGDIIVPQRRWAVLGTSIWTAQEPDGLEVPPAHVRKMIDLTARLVPAVRDLPVVAAWSATRPIIDGGGDPWQASRSFACIDHRLTDNIEGLVSVTGGKATTMRAMAQETADLICEKTGRNLPCFTREKKLVHYRHFYRR